MHTLDVHIYQPTDPRLGRHIVHDSRSREFARFTSVPKLPTTPVDHKRGCPVWDQNDIGSCTANAALGVLVTGPYWAALAKSYTESDAVQLYREETRLDDSLIPGQYEPDDTGSYFLASAKALRNRGVIAGYRHTFSLAGLLAGLSAKPASVGVGWYDSMFKPDSSGIVTISPGAQIAGGHQVCFDGHDPTRKLARFTNSWGAGWGDHGRAWISWSDLDRLLHEGGDAGSYTLR